MAETRDASHAQNGPDVAPLSWVIDEIRTALHAATHSVRKFQATKEKHESLRSARDQVHQATGALQLLDLRGVALLTDAVEQLLRSLGIPARRLPARRGQDHRSRARRGGRVPREPARGAAEPAVAPVPLLPRRAADQRRGPRASGRPDLSRPVAPAGVPQHRAAAALHRPAARQARALRIGAARLPARPQERQRAPADARCARRPRTAAATRSGAQLLVGRARPARGAAGRRDAGRRRPQARSRAPEPATAAPYRRRRRGGRAADGRRAVLRRARGRQPSARRRGQAAVRPRRADPRPTTSSRR